MVLLGPPVSGAGGMVRRPQATEDFMVHLMEDCNLCAIHAKRVTISEQPHTSAPPLPL